MAPSISVIICTHNPRPEYLSRTLDSLKNQNLPYNDWELLVIDNASSSLVEENFPISWHPNGHHLKEPRLGKTKAVLLGIAESQGDLIVLVDDDNVLSSDYLYRASQIAQDWPMLGTWGGSTIPEYEVPPPEWLRHYENYLSVRTIHKDYWFNLTDPVYYGKFPYGAGLCVRRKVADAYAEEVSKDPRRRELDRKGDSLISSGDTDLVLVGCDMGLGTGAFTKLSLIHLIHKGRLNEAYMEKMLREMTISCLILGSMRGHSFSIESRLSKIRRLLLACRYGVREWRFSRAATKGTDEAAKIVATWAKE